MKKIDEDRNSMIIIIDDNEAIHSDFAKILGGGNGQGLEDLEATIFDENEANNNGKWGFKLESAYQGKEGYEKVKNAVLRGQPFAMAFVDMRMPPGWDGLETIQHIWKVDPDLQVVICTAYSDYSWEELMENLGQTDQLLILKKPFDNAEVQQLAASLTEKWHQTQKARLKMDDLEGMVRERTQELVHANAMERKAREELRELNDSLEQKVEERTSEIEKLLRHKDEFITQLGHDIKTPLTPLTSLLPIIEKKVTDPELNELLGICTRNVSYIKNLVVGTLQLARLNSKDTVFDIRENKLLDIVNSVLFDNKTVFENNSIEIENRIDEKTIVFADGLRLREVFCNLISNTIKFTKDGGTVTIDVTEADYEGDGFAEISVMDTGIGLNEEAKTHLFEEFYKADQSRHELDSSGLGLVICKRIVEKHGGKIWAESPGRDKGTTFYFTIPKKEKIEHLAVLTA